MFTHSSLWKHVFILLGQVPRSGPAGSHRECASNECRDTSQSPAGLNHLTSAPCDSLTLCVPTSAQHYWLVSNKQTCVVQSTPPRTWKGNQQNGREGFQVLYLMRVYNHICKAPLQANDKKTNRLLKEWTKELSRTSPKIHEWPINTWRHAQHRARQMMQVKSVVKCHFRPLSGYEKKKDR